jgi:NAD(P)-dependent dehydrogenase (short-subunit alcohol dehydrogenase family)
MSLKHRPMDILLTGASGVIGGRTALHLAHHGYLLHLTARNIMKLRALKEELAARGTHVLTYPLELSNLKQSQRVVHDFFQRAGHPAALVCTAGNIGALGEFRDVDFKSWTKSITENFLSEAAMIQSFAKEFASRRCRNGSIVVLGGAGIGGNNGFANLTSYSTAKAALVHLVEALAPELQSLDITINAIAPGAVFSGITEQMLKAGTKTGAHIADARKCKETGGVSPELTAQLVHFLLSPEARTITGRLLSARFDSKKIEGNMHDIASNPNIYRLRRIDDELFFPKRS